jgi:hypothetical protein
MRRSQIAWREAALPVGSVWFARGGEVLDCVVQFGSLANAGDEMFCRKLAAGPFARRVLLLANLRETERHAEAKIKCAFGTEITVVFAQTVAEAATFFAKLAELLEARGAVIGAFAAVVAKCTARMGGETVGDVWRQQMELLPGSGPSFAANFCARFPTPHALIGEIERAAEPAAMLEKEIAVRWGRKPRKPTVDAILQLFARNGFQLRD